VTAWLAEWAWLGGDDASPDVLIEASDAGVVTRLEPRTADAPSGTVRLPGITLPGLVNAHSHAFHRALRGRAAGTDFWSWRDGMYTTAARLDPDVYVAVARACFGEMLLAGITTVYEFHYLHHPIGMDDAIFEAAAQAGIRLVFLDTCYLRAGFANEPLSPVQQRFTDGTVDAWMSRADALVAAHPSVTIGAAVHSVRAVDEGSAAAVAAWARERNAPLHLHLSEQRAENDACLAATGRTPTQLCDDAGVLGARTTAVHATHVTDSDIARLGATGTAICMCPTTERDLADGIGRASALVAAGCPVFLGTDSNAVIDLFEEARAVELDERLATGIRGSHRPAALLSAATAGASLAIGAPADFVTVCLDNPRLASFDAPTAASHLVFAGGACDVRTVVVGGTTVVTGGRHATLDVPDELRRSIATVTAP
jgi:formiminoglutamate deiminase